MSQLTEFHNLVLTVTKPDTANLMEASLSVTQVQPIYKEFIKQLHRNGFLLSRQQLGPTANGEPAFTDLRPRKSRWRYRETEFPNYIIWGNKNAALVNVDEDGYNLYVLNPETGKLETENLSKATEFKTKLKAITGKISGFTKLDLPKNFAARDVTQTMPGEEWDKLTPKERQRYTSVLSARRGEKSGDQSALTKKKTIYTLTDVTASTSKRLKPLLTKYMNRALGNILDLASAKINNFKKPQGGTHRKHREEITSLLDRASRIKNYLLFLQDEDMRADELIDLTTVINNSIHMAAAEKYPDEVRLSGFPGRLGRTQYAGSDALYAEGDGVYKFYKDLGQGNAQDLSRVMRWMGRLL